MKIPAGIPSLTYVFPSFSEARTTPVALGALIMRRIEYYVGGWDELCFFFFYET